MIWDAKNQLRQMTNIIVIKGISSIMGLLRFGNIQAAVWYASTFHLAACLSSARAALCHRLLNGARF